MKDYTKIINKYSKNNRKKYIYTNFGLILSYMLFVMLIGTLYLFNNTLKENAYKRNGNYTLVITNISNKALADIEDNVEVEQYGVAKNVENNHVQGEREKINLFSVDKNAIESLINKRIDLLEGKYPIGQNEIIITKRTEKIFNKQIGNTITIDNKIYKIVGIYKVFHSEQPRIEGMTTDNLEKAQKSYLLIKLKNERNTEKFVETIKKYNPNITIRYNDAIIAYKKESKTIIIINIIINIFCISLIFGTLNLRIRESKRDLIILRCIGCTKEKIIYMIFKRNVKLLAFTGIIGSVLGIIMLKCLIGPLILKIIRNFGGVTQDIQVRGFYIIILQILLLTIVSIVISICKPPKMKKAVIENLKIKNNVLKNTKVRKKKKYNYFLANKFTKINKKDTKLTLIAISLVIILFSLSTSYYYLAVNSNKKNYENGVTLVKTYDKNGVEEVNKLINYIKSIQGIGKIRAVGTIELKTLNLKRNNKDIVLEKSSLEEKKQNINNAQLIVCSNENFVRLKNEIKEKSKNIDAKNEAILMKNNYSEDYGIGKDGYIEIKENNEALKLDVIGDIKTDDLQDFGGEKNTKKLRFLVSVDTIENYNKLFKNNIDKVAISFDVDKISEINYFNIKNQAMKSGMIFIDRTDKGYQSRFFLRTSLLLSYLGIIVIILIVLINVINNEYILAENRQKEFSTMLLLGMDKKRLKKILIMEGLILWKEAFIYGGGISIIGITIEYCYYRWKINMEGILPPYWTILIISIIVLPISIIGKLLAIRNLRFRSLAKMNKSKEEL